MINDQYTWSDHKFRDNDVYAFSKYLITLRWLKDCKTEGSLLLNIGCGAGRFNQLALARGYQVLGYEPDPSAFALAKEYSHPKLKLVCGDLFSIPLATRADVIVMHDVLEHIDAERAAVERVSELLKDNGVLIVSVPALDRLFGFHDEQLGHFRRYTRTSVRRALRGIFSIDKVRYFGFFAIPGVYYFSRLCQKQYPIGSANSTSLLNRVLRSLMSIERWLVLPLGTSVLVMARKAEK